MSLSVKRAKLLLRASINRSNRFHYLRIVPRGGTILDVGCGNDGALKAKLLNPSVTYHGVDIGSYNNTRPEFADELFIYESEEFAERIGEMKEQYDLVMSCHNIEHCVAPMETLSALCRRLKKGGKLFLSFPNPKSVAFPKRTGSLNFYDDETHVWVPDVSAILSELRKSGVEIESCAIPSRNPIEIAVGAVMEPLSRLNRRVYFGTWAFWGFECVIIGHKS
jgi:2-polyprenyl-3-methyl-5-hydroxy-6-metoxy-1,4-benzoquinol methylase